MKNKVEIGVIGGGLIGMLTAYALTKSGANVVIFEKSESAIESSWAGGGILTPLYPWRYPEAVNALAFKSQDLYPALIDEIQAVSHIDPEFQRCGMHILTDDMDEVAYDWLKKHNVNLDNAQPDWASAAGINTVGNDIIHAEYINLPDIAQIRNPRFIKSLKRVLEKLGVIFSVSNTVQGITKRDGGTFIVETAQGEWRANKIVVCAGAWTAQLLKPLMSARQAQQFEIDIKPIRGQMLLYKAKPQVVSSIVLAKGKYIIPRLDGRVLVGSTMEDVGFNKSTTESGLFELKQFVADVCPVLADYPIEQHWAGLRPSSPNGTPYIGEHPDIKGLFVNSGHFRNGVVMAPASAALMCDLVNGKKPKFDPLVYSISR